MRIVSGIYKGRRFNPSGLKYTRPTTDFAREGLFNILNSQLEFDELKALDLFSGSGAVAFEFVSRGAAQVISVERDVSCVKFIYQVKEELNMENFDIIKADVLKYIKKTSLKFDIIFADPPYDFAGHDIVIETVLEKQLISENGMLIVEHDKHNDFSAHEKFSSQRKFGNVHFSFFSNS